MSIIYNIELLKEIIKRDKCRVDLELYKNINSNSFVDFICNCGNEHTKNLKVMFKFKALCKECQKINKANIRNEKNIDKTKKSVIYNTDLLKNICKEHNCIIDIEFYKNERLKSDTDISYICLCGKQNNKIFKNILKYGAKCTECQQKIKFKKFSETMSVKNGKDFSMIIYDINLLHKVIERDFCIVNIEEYESLDSITGDTSIYFICRCGKYGEKYLKYLYNHGALCKDCTQLEKLESMKRTNLIIYGVENALQNEDIKEKTRQTCLQKYGVEYVSQVEEFKEKAKQTCLEKYGVDHPLKSEEIRTKIKETCLEKYGFENVIQVQEFKEKSRETCLKKYSCENPFQVEEFKQKSRETCLEKYGVEYPIQNEKIKEKSRNTCLEKYGVENVTQVEEFKEKSIQTCLEKYGVKHPCQNPEILEKSRKSAYKLKMFKFPCENIVFVQGYEPFALRKLVENNYTYEDIIVSKSNVPEIWYIKDNKNHRYFCDIFIPKENRIIEVKSIWTYEIDKEEIILKGNAVKDNGYIFDLWIFDKNGNLI